MLFKILLILIACIITEARVPSLLVPAPVPEPEGPGVPEPEGPGVPEGPIGPADPVGTIEPIGPVGPFPALLPPPRIYLEDVVTSSTDLSCSISKGCPTGYACRDSNGRIINNNNQYGGGPFYLGNQQGTCGCDIRPGEVCNSDTDCPHNYLCYTPVQGACCPVSHCYTKEYVQYWRAYWANCKPPTCFFPAK